MCIKVVTSSLFDKIETYDVIKMFFLKIYHWPILLPCSPYYVQRTKVNIVPKKQKNVL